MTCVSLPWMGFIRLRQVEKIIGEMLDYLPAQVNGEYDRAIAEMKADLQDYQQEQITVC